MNCLAGLWRMCVFIRCNRLLDNKVIRSVNHLNYISYSIIFMGYRGAKSDFFRWVQNSECNFSDVKIELSNHICNDLFTLSKNTLSFRRILLAKLIDSEPMSMWSLAKSAINFLSHITHLVSTLKCMQCYSDSYEECKETQHPTECGKADDVCYSLTYSSKDVVHGSEVVNGGVKKGCTSECNKCDFYRFANKDCEVISRFLCLR